MFLVSGRIFALLKTMIRSKGEDMFFTTTVSSVIEEVASKSWPSINTDASIIEDACWEILNDNDSHYFIGRHWFRQNCVHDRKQQEKQATYH